MYKVQKRDGKAVDFDINKISGAIRSAFEAQEKPYHPDIIDFLPFVFFHNDFISNTSCFHCFNTLYQ